MRIFAGAALTASALLLASGAQAGNAANGKSIFSRCAACHTVAKGGPNMIGPNLFGVVERKAASRPDFSYSDALKNSGIVWTHDKLDAWIASPAKLVPATRMAFGGISDAQQRADLISYLDSLK